MNLARISQITHEGKPIKNVVIEETGAYSIPSEILSEPILPTALDVIRISVDRIENSYLLQASSGIVTTELLTKNVRLQIVPKFGFRALHLLLSWSRSPIDIIEDQTLPIDFSEGLGIYDLFVDRFLKTLLPVLQNGLLPTVVKDERIKNNLKGKLNLIKSYERMFLTNKIEFVQQVTHMTYGSTPNRVLKTALMCIARAKHRIDHSLADRSRQYLGFMQAISPYQDTRQALFECESILVERKIDGSRSYYYPALRECKPILQAAFRNQGGNPEYEDVPLRISMPIIFENAIRNVTHASMGAKYEIAKETGLNLYTAAKPKNFAPRLEPDIVIRRTGNPRSCLAVFDVKYKRQPNSSDHYQLAAYISAYQPQISGFITITDDPLQKGEKSYATSRSGTKIVEYAIYGGELGVSFSHYGEWLRQSIGTL